MPNKYRKMPVIVEAVPVKVLIHDAGHDWDALPDWFRSRYEQGGVVIRNDYILLPTPEGSMRAGLDDMVIRGVKGELYPCKPDIFAATYELAD